MPAATEPNAALNSSSISALRNIPLSYNNADSQASALRLVFALFPDWETDEGEVKLTRFTDGITNTLLKASKRKPGLTDEQIDDGAVLLRAYGQDTDLIIDREKERNSHMLLASRDLAPPLLARFKNGLLYRFIRGQPTSPEDLQSEPIWQGVARRLGEWHAVLPVEDTPDSVGLQPTLLAATPNSSHDDVTAPMPKSTLDNSHTLDQINAITPNKLTPNLWTVCQRWIYALPENEPALAERKNELQRELIRIVRELGEHPGLGKDGLVMSHCDLLSGNVIIEPPVSHAPPNGNGVHHGNGSTNGATNGASNGSTNGTNGTNFTNVSFIDYEYTTPAPAAFDLANHFSEWGGFSCDHSVLPTRSTRRAFLKTYLASYTAHLPASERAKLNTSTAGQQLDQLFDAVDIFRGIPGFYWGVWGLIQAEISMIDFDYKTYAEERLAEYWGWRKAEAGEADLSIRERRWAEE